MTLMSSAKGPKTLPVGLLNLMQAQQSAAQYGIMYAGPIADFIAAMVSMILIYKEFGKINKLEEATCES